MPVTATTASLVLSGAQALGGGLQAIFSGKRKAIRELENATKNNPMYSGGSSIMDYYNKALSNYSPNPYSSTLYQKSVQDARRGTQAGLTALNDRRSALSGIGKLVALQDDATLKASVAAEQEQQRRLAQLGTAANAKTGEERFRYTTNQLNPYLRRLQLLQQKAAGAAATESAGIQNIFGGLQTGATVLGGMGGKSGSTPKAAKGFGEGFTTGLFDAAKRNRRTNPIEDATFEDIQDYNTLDRGIN